MLISGIFFSTLIITLLSPLVLSFLLAGSYFFVRSQSSVEKFSYRFVRIFFLLAFLSSIISLSTWLMLHAPSRTIDFFELHLSAQYAINLRLFYDEHSVPFLTTISFISTLIGFFSHRYLHRDPHYRRFFIIISMFIFGMNLIVLSGTMDLIFAGWEIVGLASFLLIGYFWHRPKAIGAATSAYYIYRFCDLGLLASILITHFFWHDVSLFGDFQNLNKESILAHVPMLWRWALSIGILLPVLGKSAQLPFCFWLPKAMEGPTHSSAIFYGSLSIHAGVFLLIRTMPIWQHTTGFSILLLGIGASTAICATLFAQVQSNIKGQIGYASIAQVGLMLVELSFGLTTLAFMHMIGNALLRCFQLLVSGSILTTHLHMQRTIKTFGQLNNFTLPRLLPNRFKASLYVFSLNEGYLEHILTRFFAQPCLRLAQSLNTSTLSLIRFSFKLPTEQTTHFTLLSSASLVLAVIFLIIVNASIFLFPTVNEVPLTLAFIFALLALGEQKSPLRGLLFAIFSSILAFLSLNSGRPGALYLVGLFISSFIALDALYHLRERATINHINNFSGLFQQFPMLANMLLVGILGIITFPLSSTFFGEDFLLSLAIESGIYFLIIFHIIFVIIGISLIRMYSFLIFGKRNNFTSSLSLDFSSKQIFIRIVCFIIGNIAAFLLAF